MRRFATIALSLSLLLGLGAVDRLLAQDEKTSEKEAPAKAEDAKAAAPAGSTAAEVEEPLPTIPPEVEAKLEAARRAVAEAIVAAQDAGLVETSIDPPPILDILITGRALDNRQVRKAVDKADLQVGVSPEVFGAWYTGQGSTTGVVASKNIRITRPDRGLKELYDQRKEILARHIEAVRATRPALKADEPKAEEPKAEEPKAEEPKADEPAVTPAPKADEPKAVEPKADEPKDEPKADEPKDEPKADEPKDEPKADEPKAEEPKAEEAKNEPKADEPEPGV